MRFCHALYADGAITFSDCEKLFPGDTCKEVEINKSLVFVSGLYHVVPIIAVEIRRV